MAQLHTKLKWMVSLPAEPVRASGQAVNENHAHFLGVLPNQAIRRVLGLEEIPFFIGLTL